MNITTPPIPKTTVSLLTRRSFIALAGAGGLAA